MSLSDPIHVKIILFSVIIFFADDDIGETVNFKDGLFRR